MSRSRRPERPPRRNKGQPLDQRLDQLRSAHPGSQANARDEFVSPSAASAAGAETASLFRAGHKILAAATGNARRAIEAGNLQLSPEFVDLQRRAIESISESALATLQLAEAVSAASNPNQAANTPLDHGRERVAALNNIALDFFQSALSLMGAISLHGVGAAGLDLQFPIRRGEDARKTFARQFAALTIQQRSVFRLLLAGLPNKLIACELGICEATVKAHVSQILQKLKVFSRARAIALMAHYEEGDSLN
jgi:DNA-binding CsgD family transcriptional regulator